MKNILFIIFLFINPSLFGQSGDFHFPNGSFPVIQGSIQVKMESTWEMGYSNLPSFYGEEVITTNLLDSIREPGRHTIHISLSREYYTGYCNCLDGGGAGLEYKLLGHEDSLGLLFEFSWDSISWYNIADSTEQMNFFNANPVDWYWQTLEQTYPDSMINTLPTGETVFKATQFEHTIGIGLSAEYTYAGVGDLYEFHTRLTFINLGSSPVPGIAITRYGAGANYWCEYLHIQDQKGSLDIMVYPNPITTNTTLELPENTVFPASFKIFDALGRLVYENKINTHYYELKDVPIEKGVYIYLLQDSNNNYSKGKLISNPKLVLMR